VRRMPSRYRLSTGRALVWLALLAAVGVGLWRAPGTFRSSQRAADVVRGLTPVQRSLLPARSFDISTELFVAAAQDVPLDATFYVATGNGIDVSNQYVLLKAPIFAAYWLLPRRMTNDPERADWVLSYGADLSTLDLDYARVIEVGQGQQLAEVQH